MATEAGAVFVPVVPSVKNFFKELTKTVVPDAKKAGEQAGKELHAGLTKYVDGKGQVTFKPALDRREVDKQLANISQYGKNKPITVSVKVDEKQATKSAKVAADSAGRAATKSAQHHARAISGVFATAFAGLFVAAKVTDFFKESVKAGADQIKLNRQTQAVLKSTGSVAGVTAKHVADLSTKLSLQAGVADDDVQSIQNMLLTFKDIKNSKTDKIFDQTTAAALDMGTAMKISGKQAALQLGKALNDPLKGMTRLTRVGVTFTKQQQDQVKHYVKLGQTAKAQTVILKEVQSEFGGSAAAVATPADKMRTAWQALQEQIGIYLLPLLGKLANFATTRIIPAIGSFFGLINKHRDDIKQIAVQIKDFASNIAAQAFTTAKALFFALLPLLISIGQTIKRDIVPALLTWWRFLAANIIPALKSLATWIKHNQTFVQSLAVAILAMYVTFKVITLATKAWAAAQLILNTIMEANPFVIIAVALIGLAAALVYAYKHSETFRAVVQRVFNDVKTFTLHAIHDIIDGFHAFVNFFTKTIPGAFSSVIGWLRAHWKAITQIILLPFFPLPVLIWKYIGPIAGFFTSVYKGIQGIGKKIGKYFSVTFVGYFKNLGNGIKNAVSGIVGWIEKPINGVLGLLHKFINLINKIPGVNIPNVPTSIGGGSNNKAPAGTGAAKQGNAVTGGSTKLLARGGVLPGYTPGKDSVHAMLSPGEGILVPEAVRGLGPGFVHAANRHFAGGRVGKNPDNHHYLFGGIIKDVGKQLAELTRRDLQKRPPALETTQKSMESVTELGDQLTKKAVTRSEALKDLAKITDKLKDELKELSKDPALQKLEQAARASTGNDAQTAAGLQKQMESLQKQMGTPTGNPEALDKLQKELQKLQEAAKGMADKNSPGTEAEKQKMSESLSALSKQMQEMGLQLPQIDDAINAMAANQSDLVLKDLQAATTDLEKMRDMAKQMQQLQKQMEKMGKDLAEQLKNGQPEAAQMTLQKMAQQLKSANLPTEQMQKMTDEVSKAIDPAGNYGKVAEHLKKASGQMKSDDKSGASQSLADAAKELGKLMEQMGDA